MGICMYVCICLLCEEGFYGFEILDARIFLGRNILANIFRGGLSEVGIFFRYSKQYEDSW